MGGAWRPKKEEFLHFIFVLTYAAVHVGDPSKQPWLTVNKYNTYTRYNTYSIHKKNFLRAGRVSSELISDIVTSDSQACFDGPLQYTAA